MNACKILEIYHKIWNTFFLLFADNSIADIKSAGKSPDTMHANESWERPMNA
jgi:hypothetical protein